MRNLATLGGLLIFVCGASAQDHKKSDFASDIPTKLTITQSPATLPAAPIAKTAKCDYVPEQLLRMDECQLIEIYKGGSVTPVPCGYTPGVVIFKPGSKLAVPMSKLMKLTAWQGKYITCDKMINRQFGVPSIKADIQQGESWIDGGPTLVFEYYDTSLICKQYRDEVREVSLGIYLGCMHKREKETVRVATWFALDARTCTGGCLSGKK
jgi:hypothetical protein